ncbi:MAG: hypothetical protein ACLFVG_02435 [Candidatus Aminicenantes bacterium]
MRIKRIFIVFLSLMVLSVSLLAKERKGADIVIHKMDNQYLSGELIAVKQDVLLVLESGTGQDISVRIQDIGLVTVKDRPNILARAGLGLLIGAGTGALMGFVYGSDQPNGEGEESDRIQRTASEKALNLGLFFGLIGTLGGGIAGAFEGSDEVIYMEGRSSEEIEQALIKLRAKARIPSH